MNHIHYNMNFIQKFIEFFTLELKVILWKAKSDVYEGRYKPINSIKSIKYSTL